MVTRELWSTPVLEVLVRAEDAKGGMSPAFKEDDTYQFKPSG